MIWTKLDAFDQKKLRSVCQQLKYDLETVVGVNAILTGPTYDDDEDEDEDENQYLGEISFIFKKYKRFPSKY